MSFLESLIISIFRSSLTALLSLWLSERVHRWIVSGESRSRTLLWGLVMTPFFTPGLLVGFCYRDTRLNLVHLPVWNELLYFLLVLGMTLPVGVLLLQFLPPPAVSPQAGYLAHLAIDRPVNNMISRWRLMLSGSWGRRLLAATGVFLISFQEAEIASLLRTTSWTEWLFTMQAGGLVNPARYLVWVVPIELLCIVPLLPQWASQQRAATMLSCCEQPGSLERLISQVWIVVSLLLVTVIPGVMLIRGAFQGAGIVFQQPSFPREIFDALLLALTGALLTMFMIRGLESLAQPALKTSLLVLVAVPGLLGSLSLGLGLATIFQTELLYAAYDSPGPLVLGIVLYLLPRGIMVWRSLVATVRQDVQLARLLRSSGRPEQREEGLDLGWALQGNRWYWMTVLLFFWAYFELMLPSILTPPGMAPAPLLLYNALHYGRIAALATKLLITMTIPASLLALIWLSRRPLLKWFI